jgi:hypothetical protein
MHNVVITTVKQTNIPVISFYFLVRVSTVYSWEILIYNTELTTVIFLYISSLDLCEVTIGLLQYHLIIR